MYFSDDGQIVAILRAVGDQRVELWAVNRDGSGLRPLVDAADLATMGLSTGAAANELAVTQWIPGSHTLVFDIYPVIRGIGQVESLGQWSIDADTAEMRPYVPSQSDTIPGLASPDARTIAIVTDGNIRLVGPDGTNLSDNSLSFPYIGLGDYSYVPTVIWSPDSQFLRAIVPTSDPFAEDAALTTWLVPSDGSPPQTLATFSGFPLDVSLSPNQKYLAFWKPVVLHPNLRELHLAEFDGSNEVVYATGHLLEFLAWAPNSAQFVFHFGDSKEPHLGNICGGFIPLTDTAIDGWITWVDSTRFLFATGEGQSRELRLGSMNGTSSPIGGFHGDDATFKYNQEPAAVGLAE